MSESLNSTFLVARDKPILTMVDWIRVYLMRKFSALREKSLKQYGEIMPKPLKRLNRETEYNGNWFATSSTGSVFEVSHNLSTKKFIVDIDKKTCICNFWNLVSIPCRHGIYSQFQKNHKCMCIDITVRTCTKCAMRMPYLP